jgi:hypothetical protein
MKGNKMLFVDQELFVTAQNNFGREDYYPDCEWSTFFCKIHGTSVLPPALLRELKRQGFTITVKTQQL